MLDHPALAAVAAVAREGSFERAAVALGVTPSAVSQRVRGLEERVGAVLIVRGAPCRPTEAGAELCAHVERVRLLEGEVAERLPALGAEAPAGPPLLRVAVNADSLATWFLPAAAAFAEATGATLDVVRDDEGRTAARLRAGEVLAAVTADGAPVQGCRRLALGALPYVAVASPAFVRARFPAGVAAGALAAAPLLRFDRDDALQERWADATAGAALDRAPTHWIPSTQGCLDAALLGLGWGMVPSVLAAPAVAAGRLVDLGAGRGLDVPLFGQHARLGARLLAALTRAVAAAARASLRAPGPDAAGG